MNFTCNETIKAMIAAVSFIVKSGMVSAFGATDIYMKNELTLQYPIHLYLLYFFEENYYEQCEKE